MCVCVSPSLTNTATKQNSSVNLENNDNNRFPEQKPSKHKKNNSSPLRFHRRKGGRGGSYNNSYLITALCPSPRQRELRPSLLDTRHWRTQSFAETAQNTAHKEHSSNPLLHKVTTLYREIDAMLSSVQLPPLSILSLARADSSVVACAPGLCASEGSTPAWGSISSEPNSAPYPNLTLTSDLTSEPDPNLPLDLPALLPIPTSEPGRSPSEPTNGPELAYIQTCSLLPNLLLVR
jgi:hypothetical protein